MGKAKFQSKQEFIDWTHSDDFRLSASSLASFCTPWSFMAYHLKERKETAAMLEGKLIHCMVLEREKLEASKDPSGLLPGHFLYQDAPRDPFSNRTQKRHFG